MRHRSFLTGAILFLGALTLSAPAARAQSVTVQAESFLPPPASGPNQSDVVSTDGTIGFFIAWDYLEWDVDIPEDGLYTITYRYASDWGLPDTNQIPQVLTFWDAGPQYAFSVPWTRASGGSPGSGWANYQEYTVPGIQVPLTKGIHRFRLQIRPDNAVNDQSGTGMNMDWIRFDKVAAYPAMSSITGTVTGALSGSTTPLQGAYVSIGDPYTEATYLTRTDATGHYTLNVPAGSQSLTAFYNGFSKATATVTAPGTRDFALTYSGKFEAELFQVTNPGPGDTNGFQPAYNTNQSNNGLLWVGAADKNSPPKYAVYTNVVVPESGVYALSMNYMTWKVNPNTGYGTFAWSANNGPAANLRYADTSTFQDSGQVLLELQKGVNTIRVTNVDSASLAVVDYFTLTKTTQPVGYAKVLVVNQANNAPISTATVTLDNGDTSVSGISYSGATAGDGTITFPASPGTYTATANTAIAAAPVSQPITVVANQTASVTIPLQLTAIAIEAEDFVAVGPGPGAVSIQSDASASGGKFVTDFSGALRQEWLEWDVTVPEDGLYEMTARLAATAPPAEHTVNFWNTTYQIHIPEITGTGFQVYQYVDATQFPEFPFQIPMKKGTNRVRITMNAGDLSLDYLQFKKVANLPAMGTVTGTVRGTDGTGTAPIQNAQVYADKADTDVNTATYYTLSDAAGQYTLLMTAGSHNVGVDANGYTSANPQSVNTGTTKDFTLSTNLPNGLTFQPEVLPVTQVDINTSGGEIWNTAPDKWIELTVSVPRSGMYQVGMLYSSGWNVDTAPNELVQTTWTVNGTDKVVSFPKTTSWSDYQTIANLTTIPLSAGPNTIRITWNVAGSNIQEMTFTRTGALPELPTDIDQNGRTDIRDAVLYARRLNGLDAGPTPDVTGDGKSDAADVRKILSVAGGLS